MESKCGLKQQDDSKVEALETKFQGGLKRNTKNEERKLGHNSKGNKENWEHCNKMYGGSRKMYDAFKKYSKSNKIKMLQLFSFLFHYFVAILKYLVSKGIFMLIIT